METRIGVSLSRQVERWWRNLQAPPKRDAKSRSEAVWSSLFLWGTVIGLFAVGIGTSRYSILLSILFLTLALSLFLDAVAETAPIFWSPLLLVGLRLASWVGITATVLVGGWLVIF